MNTFKALLGSLRPNFLLLPLSILALTGILANEAVDNWSWALTFLIVLSALVAHGAVNWLNEYHDWASGLDDLTDKTPFSGGSGSLQAYPLAAEKVAAMGYGSLGFLLVVGGFLVYLTGWPLLLLGVVGLLLIVLYTPVITRWPWVCLIAPGLAFGPIIMNGSYYVWTQSFDWGVFVLSWMPFFLVNNLLLLNQFPDLKADREVGRYNIIMHLGERAALNIYLGFLWVSFAVLWVSVVWAGLSNGVLWGSLMATLALLVTRQLWGRPPDYQQMPQVFGWNVLLNLLTPLLSGLGLVLA